MLRRCPVGNELSVPPGGQRGCVGGPAVPPTHAPVDQLAGLKLYRAGVGLNICGTTDTRSECA